MPRKRAMILWTTVAAVLPVFAAYAADATPTAPTPVVTVSPPDPAPAAAPSLTSQGLRLNSPPSGLNYKVDVPAPALRPDDFRFDLADRSASAAALKLTPVINSPRAGWHFSGRVGPLRWLTPLDGDGATNLRFGERVPGQPRTPGMGIYNISVHYTFE